MRSRAGRAASAGGRQRAPIQWHSRKQLPPRVTVELDEDRPMKGCSMKRAICSLRCDLARSAARVAAASAQTLKAVKDRGSLICGVEPGTAGILQSRRQGQLDRLRRRFLPCDRGGGLERCHQGQVHAALRQGSVRAAQDRRHRRAVAQHHLDACRATSPTAISPASPITTARASWCARRSRSIRRSSSTARRSARRPAPRPSSTSPTSSAPTT